MKIVYSIKKKWRKDGEFEFASVSWKATMLSSLAEAGAPIPVCLQMQQLELSLGKAQWSTRQTCWGFSVSFFWLMSPAKSARNVSSVQFSSF